MGSALHAGSEARFHWGDVTLTPADVRRACKAWDLEYLAHAWPQVAELINRGTVGEFIVRKYPTSPGWFMLHAKTGESEVTETKIRPQGASGQLVLVCDEIDPPRFGSLPECCRPSRSLVTSSASLRFSLACLSYSASRRRSSSLKSARASS